MKRIKWLLMLVLMFTLALVIAGCGSDNNDSSANGGDNNGNNNASSNNDGGDEGGEILIGVPQPLTGPSAAEGQDMANGAELAVKHINDEGGVLGKQLKVVVEDEACDPQVAATAANKLVKDEVSVIVGH